MILLQGHVVTLTFKVATQMLRTTRHLNMVNIFKNSLEIRLKMMQLWAGHELDVWTD